MENIKEQLATLVDWPIDTILKVQKEDGYISFCVGTSFISSTWYYVKLTPTGKIKKNSLRKAKY